MPEPHAHDPLRAAFKDAAAAGQRAAAAPPVALITARGDSRRRMRLALVAAACMAVGSTAALGTMLLPSGERSVPRPPVHR